MAMIDRKSSTRKTIRDSVRQATYVSQIWHCSCAAQNRSITNVEQLLTHRVHRSRRHHALIYTDPLHTQRLRGLLEQSNVGCLNHEHYLWSE